MGSWYLVISTAALMVSSPATAQSRDDALPPDTPVEAAGDLIEVAFDKDRYERMTVPVTIGGQGPYRFFIDTGAQATVVTRSVTEAISLAPSGRATLVAMGSTKTVDTVQIDELEFADRTFSGLTAALLEKEHIGADGILGLDSLQDLRVLIDFAADSMSVTDAREFGGNTGYEIVVRARAKLGQMIITDAKLDGVRTAVIIDTGAQNSMGNLALLKKLRKQANQEIESTDVHGVKVKSNLAVAERLVIGDMELQDIPIGFADSPAIDALGFAERPALILGMGNLRLFERVAIDFATRRVLFDLPGGTHRRDLLRDQFMASRLRS
ncbi:aspartyl protease family protein [Qipengyuania vulgaris]|nr:aspartyl protease family protein [Qipengyuania vulgaris]